MMAEVKIKKWGNSLGVILPKNLVQEGSLHENDRLVITVAKRANLTSLFGSLKMGKTGQQFKDEVRKGWKEKKFK